MAMPCASRFAALPFSMPDASRPIGAEAGWFPLFLFLFGSFELRELSDGRSNQLHTRNCLTPGGERMYQALYRKWRPRLFDDVVGQSHITRTLKRQVMSDHLSHAYLFTGTRGTGKTTCAKLLARAVNCLHPVEGNPCGTCEACRGIEDGSILDVVELDAASNNGVDQVRALREEAVYAPAAVKRRVYIVDEVHMLSTGAFNALLKILEEPPEHVLFILATTELHKVPATILSRCQRFSFKRIQAADIQNRLLYIAQAEGIDLTEDAAALLSRLSDGALRDALSLLDQCAVGEGTVDREAVQNALGLAGNTKTAHIMNHIRRGETAKALTLLSELYAAGKDVGSVLSELSGLTRDLLLRSTTGADAPGLMAGGYDEATLQYLAKGMSPQRLLHILTVLQDAQARLKTSADRRTEAELCLIRLCDQRLDGSVLSLSQRLSRLEAALASGQRPAIVPGENPPPFVPGAGEEDAEPLPAELTEAPEQQNSVPAEDTPPMGMTAEESIFPAEDTPPTVVAAEEASFPAEETPPASVAAEEALFPAEDLPPTVVAAEKVPFPADFAPPEEIPFPAEAPPELPPDEAPVPRPQGRSRQSSRTTSARKRVPPQEGGDAWFWDQLAPALEETLGMTGRSMVATGLVKGQYWPGLLRLYVNNPWAEGWMSDPERRGQVERAASMQAGQSVRVEVILGPTPKPRQPTDPALPQFERQEPEERGTGEGGAESNFRDFLELARGQEFVEIRED